jgi:hypothetical protein
MIPYWFTVSFWSVAFVVSAFLGVFCFEIHRLGRDDFDRASKTQQVWFNFIGSVFGWVALRCLVRRAWGVNWLSAGASNAATIADFVLAFAAFIGICGYLPYTVMGIVDALRVLAQKALERAGELITPKA